MPPMLRQALDVIALYWAEGSIMEDSTFRAFELKAVRLLKGDHEGSRVPLYY